MVSVNVTVFESLCAPALSFSLCHFVFLSHKSVSAAGVSRSGLLCPHWTKPAPVYLQWGLQRGRAGLHGHWPVSDRSWRLLRWVCPLCVRWTGQGKTFWLTFHIMCVTSCGPQGAAACCQMTLSVTSESAVLCSVLCSVPLWVPLWVWHSVGRWLQPKELLHTWFLPPECQLQHRGTWTSWVSHFTLLNVCMDQYLNLQAASSRAAELSRHLLLCPSGAPVSRATLVMVKSALGTSWSVWMTWTQNQEASGRVSWAMPSLCLVCGFSLRWFGP